MNADRLGKVTWRRLPKRKSKKFRLKLAKLPRKRTKSTDVVIEFFSGTGSVVKYHLRRSIKVRVVMIDTQSKEWARKHIPSIYWPRICYIHKDVLDSSVSAHGIMTSIFKRWPALKPKHFSLYEIKDGLCDISPCIKAINIIHIHGSPSCRSHSGVDRGLTGHRDMYGRPLSKTAIMDDRVLHKFVQELGILMSYYPGMLVTIENPVSPTFMMVPDVARLIRWRDPCQEGTQFMPMTCSYCKHTDPVLDGKAFPQKDTFIIAAGVKKTLKLCMCARDCPHLLDIVKPSQHR